MTKKQLEAVIKQLKTEIEITTEVNAKLQWEIAGLKIELQKVKNENIS